ncbi:MAG TPA: 4-(cytidine 5'-diphospho)-2-C-methyl-D-erythritol kinase [Mycobacteriales bacterium]
MDPTRGLAGVPEPITVRAHAKINLALQVQPKGPDGYHELHTVFQSVSLHDEVTASPAVGLGVHVRGDGAGSVPADRSNLAARAALLLAEHAGVRCDVRLEIVKGIPVAGGMAGGSADAAAALVACDALWGTGCDRHELAGLAAQVGSDVPFALHGGTSLGTGRGQVLSEVLARGTYHWVVAVAGTGLSTPAVYAAFDDLGARTGPPPDAVIAALRGGDAEALGKALSNDLEPAAVSLLPSLRRTLESGRELGALGAIVSGSGPTVVLLCRDRRHQTRLAAAVAGEGVCRSVRTAHGPVPGARIT